MHACTNSFLGICARCGSRCRRLVSVASLCPLAGVACVFACVFVGLLLVASFPSVSFDASPYTQQNKMRFPSILSAAVVSDSSACFRFSQARRSWPRLAMAGTWYRSRGVHHGRRQVTTQFHVHSLPWRRSPELVRRHISPFLKSFCSFGRVGRAKLFRGTHSVVTSLGA